MRLTDITRISNKDVHMRLLDWPMNITILIPGVRIGMIVYLNDCRQENTCTHPP